METNILLLNYNNELAQFEAVVAQSVDDEDGSLFMSLVDTAWKTQRRGQDIVFMFPPADWDQFTGWCSEHGLSIMKLNESEWHLDNFPPAPAGRARSVCSETDRNGTDTFLDRATDMLRAGQSMFITGEGGSGKSHLAWQLYQYALKELKWDPVQIAVTAYTGVAAQELLAKKPVTVPLVRGVTTLHAFMGMMPGLKTTEQLQAYIERTPELRLRWTSTFMLIIDEISMVDGRLFTMLYEMRARFNNRMVIVCLGDFCQLPPQTIEQRDMATGKVMPVFDFCFKVPAWATLIGNRHVISLTTNYRIDNDRDWRKLLKRIRMGHQTEFDRQFLLRLRDQPVTEDHVRIFCRRLQVQEYNKTYFERLIADGRATQTYRLQWTSAEMVMHPQARNETVLSVPIPDGQYPTQESVRNFMKTLVGEMGRTPDPLPTQITLCVGARVIYERNLLDEGLGNGMQGTVVELADDHVQVLFMNCEQPTRVNFVEHVACSDLITTEGEPRLYRVKCLILPLQLAGAITVHKSQGMTLDKVYIKLYDERLDNGKLKYISTIDFEGQVYVALSRGRTSANIIVDSKFERDDDWSRVKQHPDVVTFYNSLNDVAPKPAASGPRNTFGNLLDPRWLHKPVNVTETMLFILYQREKVYNARLATQRDKGPDSSNKKQKT